MLTSVLKKAAHWLIFPCDPCPMHCEDQTGDIRDTKHLQRASEVRKQKGKGWNSLHPTWKSHKPFTAQGNDEARAFLTVMRRRKAGLWKIESYFLALSVSRSWNSDKFGGKQLSMCWSAVIVNLMSATAAQGTPVAFAASAPAENANFLKIHAFMSSRTTQKPWENSSQDYRLTKVCCKMIEPVWAPGAVL